MNQKGFSNIVFIILVVILVGTAGYLVFNQGNSVPAPVPSPIPASGSKNNTVSLREQFTLKKGQVAKIADTGLEVGITAFYNSPCPAGVECFWSGVGIEFEYRFNGQVQKGINLVQAFGYQTTIVKTDYEIYANLVVENSRVRSLHQIPR